MKLKRIYGFKIVLILLTLAPVINASYFPMRVTEAQVGGQISYGTSIFGTVSTAAPSVPYSFAGAAGDLVQIEVKELTGGLDPSVDLIGPDQQVLASGQRNRLALRSQDAYIAAVLPQAGVYNLLVSGVGGTAGDFVLRLHGRSLMASTPLVYGQTIQVTIPQNALSQYFRFYAEDCPTTLTVTNLSGGEPFAFPFVVKVRNQQGREIALLKGGDVQEDRVTVAPLSGLYEVEVLADDPLLTGAIALLVTCAENAPGCQGDGATAGAVCPSCPDCGADTGAPSGNVPVCPDMNLTTVPGAPGVTFTWHTVPDADFYRLHIYGQHGDEEVYLGAAGVPGDATDYHLDHLFDGFWGFRFVLEAVQGEEVICSEETQIKRAEPGPTCDDFTLTGEVLSHVDRTVTWTWDAYPGAEMYAGSVYFILPDGSEARLGDEAHEPATTSVTHQYELGVAPSDIWRFRLNVIIGGEIICTAEDTIEFERQGPGQVEWPDCEHFAVSVAEQTDSGVTIEWTEYPGAEQYWFYVMDAHGMMLPGYPSFVPASTLRAMINLTPGTYTIGVSPWIPPDGAVCLQGLTVAIEGTQQAATCLIRADRGDVRVHVGPGRNRNVFTYLTAHREYVVTGQALDDEGNLWWQIDKTQIPGHEAVISLWVAESDVFEIGDCEQIPEEEAPPIIPEDQGPGTWLPCGSCDTCGHPANECVTSPTGECLWDPATCLQQPPGDGGEEPGPGGEEPSPGGEQPAQCVTVTASVDPSGTGSAGPITHGNCISEIAGIYLPGTNVQVRANPNPGCWLDHWSGCGASGAANPVSITVTGSCHIVAHIQCMQ
jgi:hypothetical protein